MADTEPQMEVEQQQEEVVEGVSNPEEAANEVVEEAYRPAGSDKLSNQSRCLSVSFFLRDKEANKADFHSGKSGVCSIL